MAGNTKTFTVTSAVPVAITAVGITTSVSVGEDPGVVGWPTTAWLVGKPRSSSQQITQPPGGAYTFESSYVIPRAWNSAYQPGDIIGYVQLVNGASPTTFYQDEK